MTRATTGRLRQIIFTVSLAALAVGALGCSANSTSTTTNRGTLATLGTDDVTTTDVASAKAVCDAPTMTTEAQKKYPGATLDQLVCDNNVAIATIIGAAGIDGDGVILFKAKLGAWSILAADSVNADPSKLVGSEFPLSTYNIWKTKYDQIHNPQAPTTRGPYVPPTQDYRHACDAMPDSKCEITTTIDDSFTIPTTTIPVTTLPPITAPEVTTVPPTTTGGGGGGGISAYCQAHPLDKNCLANPGFPG